ncbi:MAG: HAD hydrolase family protein [Flavobacteriaceae bacterium]|nr:HAD hydrolase family protein [Bacteroidia bacterium]NNL16433.1 HAD hydrolase family protein [Flavobacteriaceae bacterium]
MGKNYKEYLSNITTFIFDVDGVLASDQLLVTSSGELLRSMHSKDGMAIKIAIKKGFNVAIISGGTNEGVRKRLEGLDVKDIYLGISDKIETYKKYVDLKNLDPENVLYMGDDLSDYELMQVIGLPCAPQDAIPEIKAISKYVSHKKGGKGCARDVIEQVLKVQGKWMTEFKTKQRS